MKHAIPVIIPTFNNPTYLQNMLKQLERLGVTDIMVVDSASTSSGMSTLLDSLDKKISVIRLTHNHGPRFYYENKDFYRQLPEYFCLTDPDLAFNDRMPRTFLEELVQLSEQFKIGKVGLALDLSDAKKMRTDRIQFKGKEYHIWEWEAKFWLNPIGETPQHDSVYNAEVDTTFALYNKRYFNRNQPENAIRVAGRYTCRHLPWYRENLLPSLEEREYRTTQQHSWYLGGPRASIANQTLSERLQKNILLAKRYGVLLWLGEKLTRWMSMSESQKKIKIRMKLKDGD